MTAARDTDTSIQIPPDSGSSLSPGHVGSTLLTANHSSAPAGTEPRKRRLRGPESRQWLPLIIVAVLAFAIIVPPLFNIERYQHRIADNISRSLGRPVHFSHIHLRLLPRPGFDLTDFTVDESTEFGSEPILHSSSVSASIRLLSLWRGRLEIARIALDEPSLNLVRNAAGRWNFASVMTQASRSTIAPTGQMRPSRTLRFPYIEATNARVNFKYGDEKQPFSFLNGELAAWLENPGEWQLRFKAQPVRTDLDLYAADTGLVRIQGSMQRAETLGSVPLDLRVDWERAPLGQVGRLLNEQDACWRGDLDIRSRVRGTPDKLALNTTLSLTSLHRVEFAPDHALDFSAKCTGTFAKAQASLEDLNCLLPVSSGTITATGGVQQHQPHIDVSIAQVPAAAALNFLRLTRRNFAPGISVDGDASGHFALGSRNDHTTLTGSASVGRLLINAPGLDNPLTIAGARLTALPAPRSARGNLTPAPPTLLLSPVKLDLGAASPMLMDGRFDARGFQLHLGGTSSLTRVIPVIHSLGLSAPGVQSLQPTGEASLDVLLRGPWLLPLEAFDSDHPLPAQSPTGTITLHNARLETPYLSAPLEIDSAQASLFGTQIAWSGIVAQYGPIHFTGAFRAPISSCQPGIACVRQFDIALSTLDLAALPSVLVGNDPLMQQLLHRIQNGASAPGWPALHGTVRVAAATLGTLSLQDAVASLDIEGSQVRIDSLDARAASGTMHFSGTIHAGPSPSYALDAQWNQASIPALGNLFHQEWGTGTINMAAHLTFKGLHQDELTSSTSGQYHFDWSRGSLHLQPHAPATPFSQFEQWTADGTVSDAAFNLDQSLLTNSDGAHSVQGTIGFDRRIDLRTSAASPSSTGSDSGTVTGTLDEPVSAPAPPVQPR